MDKQLKIYDYLDIVMQEYQQQQWFKNFQLHFFVSDIMSHLNIDSAQEIAISMNRTFDVCNTLQISKPQNFKKIYRFDGKNLLIDWKISSLACYLIIINCNPTNEFVARAQLHFALNRYKNN
jgi:hypothetical protein